MPIDLSLTRVTRLLLHLKFPHCEYKSIHVAGTNGKGSIVAYISSILTSANIRNGRFTSPHMLHPNDSVCINTRPYPSEKFKEMSRRVQDWDTQFGTECTEFELLTVTAFMIFKLEKVKVAVIEVGMGGRFDATNVLQPVMGHNGRLTGVVATAISKIGMDHEGMLGNSPAEIAFQKAGIIKPRVPCIVDASNCSQVLAVVESVAKEKESELHRVSGRELRLAESQASPLQGAYQKQNLAVALKAINILQRDHGDACPISDTDIVRGISSTLWQGRLEIIKIPGFDEEIILDGAHNASAAIELAKYLKTIRNGCGIIFVVAMTEGKDCDKLFQHVIEKEIDTVVPTTFTLPEQMPWIKPMAIDRIQQVAASYVGPGHVRAIEENGSENDIATVLSLIITAKQKNNDSRRIVVCGLLYLCGDVLRHVKQHER